MLQVIVEGILAAIDNLEQFPLLGRTVPERSRDDLRELIKPPYRIVYRVSEAIYILTIFRTSRMFPSSLGVTACLLIKPKHRRIRSQV